MKINKLDAHDRLIHFQKQADYISHGCQECINNRPKAFENHPFYIFAHARTDDDGVTKRLIWEPRLTKPKAQTNSMLFFVVKVPDLIRIIWIIPARELWEQYQYKFLTESKEISESIELFKNNREVLESKEPEEVDDNLKISIMKKVREEYIQNKNEIKKQELIV